MTTFTCYRKIILFLKFWSICIGIIFSSAIPVISQIVSQYGSKTGQLVIFTDTDALLRVHNHSPTGPEMLQFARIVKGLANRIDVPLGRQELKFFHPLFDWKYEITSSIEFLGTDTIRLSLLPKVNPQLKPLDSLFFWIEANDRNRYIQALQQHSEYINQQDNAKNQLIHYAAWFNRKELVKLLLDWKVNPDIQNQQGKTPLHLATTVNLLTILVDSKANAVLKDVDGNNPVHIALHQRNNLALSLWQRAEVDWSVPDEFGRCGLHYPCDTTQLSKRLKTAKVAINLPDRFGYTPIFYATSLLAVEMLLKAGADPLHQAQNGRTVLHFANDLSIVQFIQKQMPAKWNAVDKMGQTPLHTITDANVAHFWAKNGLDVNQADIFYQTPLVYSIIRADSAYASAKRGIERHKPQILEQLVKGQQLNILSNQTAIQLVSQLTDDGASLNFSHTKGKAPLFFARHDPLIIQRLLAVGANPNIVDSDGNTPLFYVRTVEGCQALLNGGALIKHSNKAGQTAIQYIRADVNFSERDAILDFLENAGRTKP